MQAKIAQRLEHLDFQEDAFQHFRKELVEQLHQSIVAIDENKFSAKMRIEYIHRYRQLDKWSSISDAMIQELEEQVVSLITAKADHELEKRFDWFLYNIELSQLKGKLATRQAANIMETAEQLAEKGNLPQIQKQK